MHVFGRYALLDTRDRWAYCLRSWSRLFIDGSDVFIGFIKLEKVAYANRVRCRLIGAEH